LTKVKRAAHSAVLYVAGGLAVALYAVAVVPLGRLSRRRRIKAGRSPRVAWGPVPVINIRFCALADRARGYPSETVIYRPYSINARAQFDRVLDRYDRIPLLRDLVPFCVFIWGSLTHDIFGFFFDGGFLWMTPFWRTELKLLRAARKEILVYPYGSDARLPSSTRALGPWNAYTDVLPGTEDRDEADVRRRLDAFARHASVMLGCADLYEDLPRRDGMMRYAFDQESWAPQPHHAHDTIRVVHAPNHRYVKGTRFLIAAVDELRAEGLPLELVLVERMPNDQARLVYQEADIIADQFLIGAYALFAIEGMALGKPVICYLNPRFYRYHPEWSECPIVSANPDELKAALRRLATDDKLRRDLGARGPGYVERFHSLQSVGRDLDAIYSRLWR
jgi:hypothetical protein